MTSTPHADPVRVRLPAAMDATSAEPLTRDLLALRGQPIHLDASGVERLGGLGLQVLLAARLTWRSDRIAFQLIEASDAFQADCALLGASAFDDSQGRTAS